MGHQEDIARGYSQEGEIHCQLLDVTLLRCDGVYYTKKLLYGKD